MSELVARFWELPAPVQTVLSVLALGIVAWVVHMVWRVVWMVVLLVWNLALIVYSGVRWVYWLLMGGLGKLVNTTDSTYRMVDGRRVKAKSVPVVQFSFKRGKQRVIPVPDISLSKQVALRTRADWNRLRDSVAPVVLARDEWYCQWCDASLDETNWSIDHIMPISKGGTNELHNLQAMCRSCNSVKGSSTDGWGKFWDRVAA